MLPCSVRNNPFKVTMTGVHFPILSKQSVMVRGASPFFALLLVEVSMFIRRKWTGVNQGMEGMLCALLKTYADRINHMAISWLFFEEAESWANAATILIHLVFKEQLTRQSFLISFCLMLSKSN